MSKPVALVTGASSGIGEATARKLLDAGYVVYAAARRTDRMEALRAAGAEIVGLDVTDDVSVRGAFDTVAAGTGRLDVLVNNAGYGSYGALEDVSLDEARRQFDVNVFGVARVTQLALPMMRARRSGTIVNISSVGGKVWEPFGAWYHASKFAIEGLSDCLRVEVKPFGIDVVVIEPGAIRSEWSGIAADGLVSASGKGAYANHARTYAQKALRDAYERSSVSPPEVVADAIVKALESGSPRTRYAVGGGAGMVLMMKRLMPDRLFDKMIWSQAK